MKRASIGFLVNPIAGMGGTVGLRGTDSDEILREAQARGAVAKAPQRAQHVLAVLANAAERLDLIAAGGDMGADVARVVGLRVTAIRGGRRGETTPLDTGRAAAEMLERGVEIILFAGGDGTARDICAVVGERVPVIGIPAGVKMHSAVYAVSPRAAGELILQFLEAGLPLRPMEVMDIDEEAYRRGTVQTRLYGYMNVPFHRNLLQGAKIGRVNSDLRALQAIAVDVVERLERDRLYVLGPGTTTRAIAEQLGLKKTLLGVDILLNGAILQADADEAMLLKTLSGRKTTLIVTPIGGQGHILGRGNQQISPAVLRRIGKDRIIVVATPEKLASLSGQPLRVDTGDPDLDRALCGYLRVITGYRTENVCLVSI